MGTAWATFTSAAVPVSGNNSYGSGNFASNLAGTWKWIASYSGDVNNNAVAGGCNDANESVVVQKAQPTVTTQAGPPFGTLIGNPLSDTAMLADGYNPGEVFAVYHLVLPAGLTAPVPHTGTKEATE